MDDIGEFLGRAQATYDAGEKMLRQMRSDAAAPKPKPEAPVTIPLAGNVIDDEQAEEIARLARREKAKQQILAEEARLAAEAEAERKQRVAAERQRQRRNSAIGGLIYG